MSINLKRSIYVSLATLMALSTGVASASNVNASHRKTQTIGRHYYTRRVYRHYHMTSQWNRHVNSNYRLNGRYAISNKPNILRGARTVVPAGSARGARVYTTRGRMYNHVYRYWYVIIKNGRHSGSRGWINARGVHYSRTHSHKQVVYVPKNNKQYANVLMNIVKAQTSGDVAQTSDIHSNQYRQTIDTANAALAQAKSELGQISNNTDKNDARTKIAKASAFINSIENGKKTRYDNTQSQLNGQISQDLQVAHADLLQAQHTNGSEHSSAVAQAMRMIGNAKLYDSRVVDPSSKRANQTSIQTMSDYANAVKDNHARSHTPASDINARETIAADDATRGGIQSGKASLNEWRQAILHSHNFSQEVQDKVKAHNNMNKLSADIQADKTAKRLASNAQVKKRIQNKINTLQGYATQIANAVARR